MPACSTFQKIKPSAQTGPSMILTIVPGPICVSRLLLTAGSERTRLGKPGVTRASPPAFKRVKPIAQAGRVGAGVGLLVGVDATVDVGLFVEVGARVGVTTVSVGNGVMLMALL